MVVQECSLAWSTISIIFDEMTFKQVAGFKEHWTMEMKPKLNSTLQMFQLLQIQQKDIDVLENC